MGADMVSAGLVLVDGVEVDWEPARARVAELQEDDVDDWFDDVEQMRVGLLADITALEKARAGEGREARELDSFQLGPYRLYLTGGLSWGDSPTELFDVICRLDAYGLAGLAGFGITVPA